MIAAINVRFFVWAETEYGTYDLVEVTEACWLEEGGDATYQRLTVSENGVRQICLTKDNAECKPHVDDLETVK